MLARCILIGLLAFGLNTAARAAGTAERVVLVVWDGLRPDLVTPELTPTLWQLRTNGVWFAQHHPVFPSITEANGAALMTGDYPRHSDVLADNEFRADINTNRAIGMENLKAIRRGDELNSNHFLAAPTLPEVLQHHGFRTAVAGSKTVALLLDRADRQGDDARGLVLFPNTTLPASWWPQLTNRFGPPPQSRTPNTARDEWTIRCMTEGFWGKDVPRLSILWMSDPDATQHSRGVGSAADLDAIRGLDRNLALLLQELDRRKARARTDLVVVSDHGFSTVTQIVDTAAALQRAGLNARRQFQRPATNGDILVVNNGGAVLIYVMGRKADVVQKAVAALQQQNFTGALFTRDALPGTFAQSDACLDSPHAPDIVVSMGWQPGVMTNRLPGIIFEDGTSRGSRHGMHATLSPTDMHNTCIASGPDFRAGFTNTTPSGNVDITPTLLWLFDIKPPQPTDGRVLFEALTGANAPSPAIAQRKLQAHAVLPGGTWTQYLSLTTVNGVRYIDEGGGAFALQVSTNTPPLNAGNP